MNAPIPMHRHVHLGGAEETCRSLSHLPQEGHQKLSNLQRCVHVFKFDSY